MGKIKGLKLPLDEIERRIEESKRKRAETKKKEMEEWDKKYDSGRNVITPAFIGLISEGREIN